ncbi:Crp/Fnr family transcriptional regulator [Spongiimicrobium salis]|uniref:Crp/Fnr family transcriptional regulator n=1 Tax=Spongiimicrobium salis TaxID=1667022 RepID=UPI00374D48D8
MNAYFSKFLHKAGNYTEQELDLLRTELQLRTLQKDDRLLTQGEICSSLSFILQGAAYHYTLDHDNEKAIIELSVPGDWIINHKSFTGRKPSEYMIQCSEITTIYTLSIDAIHKLIAASQSFLQLGKVLEEAVSRLAFFDHDYTPDKKYLHLLEHRPELFQKFSQKTIASYLKVTPETLSRVRKRFSKT